MRILILPAFLAMGLAAQTPTPPTTEQGPSGQTATAPQTADAVAEWSQTRQAIRNLLPPRAGNRTFSLPGVIVANRAAVVASERSCAIPLVNVTPARSGEMDRAMIVRPADRGAVDIRAVIPAPPSCSEPRR
jgi:hypothetical protein